MLAEVGLLTGDERDAIVAELDRILEEITGGEFPFRTELEDVHMHIESALIERLGDVGRKLHTARSRNDQVSTDLKLYVRDGIDTIDGLLLELQRAFVARGETDAGVILPAYTHLQRAQPVQATQYWLAYCEKFDRDRGRLADCRNRLNVSPLGARHLPARACRSTGSKPRPNWDSTRRPATAWTFPVIVISWSSSPRRWPWSRCTSAAGPRNGSCGARPSST
ncbi:MAG: hypothetical protein Ct9H300mP1_00050 [Planctomycetaceae bacterium]|nr:MAG: hypothetical protein Ct9H300mP1_00050 [Planctomycetaceae bacterium]